MKKVTFILSLLMVAGICNLSAQTREEAVTVIPSLKLVEGKNTVRTPDGSSSFQFLKRGDSFTDVIFTDEHGHEIRLSAVPGSTNGSIPTPCPWPIPDACYSIPNASKIGMCMCKATDLSTGEYNISFVRAVLTCRKSGGDRY